MISFSIHFAGGRRLALPPYRLPVGDGDQPFVNGVGVLVVAPLVAVHVRTEFDCLADEVDAAVGEAEDGAAGMDAGKTSPRLPHRTKIIIQPGAAHRHLAGSFLIVVGAPDGKHNRGAGEIRIAALIPISIAPFAYGR